MPEGQKAEKTALMEQQISRNPCPPPDWQGSERKAFYKLAVVLATK